MAAARRCITTERGGGRTQLKAKQQQNSSKTGSKKRAVKQAAKFHRTTRWPRVSQPVQEDAADTFSLSISQETRIMKRRIFLTLAAAAAGVLFNATAAQAADPVKIGFLVKQPEEPWFQDEWKFAEIAAPSG
jgi:hypothetical protein